MTSEEARTIIDKAEYWHYRFELPWTTTVPGKRGWAERVEKRRHHFFEPLVDHYKGSLHGKLVYDLGCCQGFWSFAAKSAGALYCHGIDACEAFVNEAEAVKYVLGMGGCTFSQGNLETPECWRHLDRRDITLLLGCLYHTTDPIYVLRNAMEKTSETIVFDGEVVPSQDAIWKTVKRTPGEPTTIRSGMQSDLRTIPSVNGIVAILEDGGFKKIKVLEPAFDMPKDYLVSTTASIIASR
jgi:SAM-dependent methyltransferase